jgi:hypothetical protein
VEPIPAAHINAVPRDSCLNHEEFSAPLKTCGDVVGERNVFVNPGLYNSVTEMDDQVADIVAKIANDTTHPFHQCVESARLLTCSRHFPQCDVDDILEDVQVQGLPSVKFHGLDAQVCLAIASTCKTLTPSQVQSFCTSPERADVMAHTAALDYSNATAAGYTDLFNHTLVKDAVVHIGQRQYVSKAASDAAVENAKSDISLGVPAFVGIIVSSLMVGALIAVAATKVSQKSSPKSAASTADQIDLSFSGQD